MPALDLGQAASPGQRELDGAVHDLCRRRGIRVRFLVHLSDFTTGGSPDEAQVDEGILEDCGTAPEDIGWFFPRGEDIFGITMQGSATIRKCLSNPRLLRAVRRFNLTHMNRGRNAYQASHSYSVADRMLGI